MRTERVASAEGQVLRNALDGKITLPGHVGVLATTEGVVLNGQALVEPELSSASCVVPPRSQTNARRVRSRRSSTPAGSTPSAPQARASQPQSNASCPGGERRSVRLSIYAPIKNNDLARVAETLDLDNDVTDRDPLLAHTERAPDLTDEQASTVAARLFTIGL